MHALSPNIRSVGFIGTGTLTEAVVRGLCANPNPLAIHLSPRSEAQSLALAAEFPNVTREASNADVVAKADCVVLAMRPQQFVSAIAELTFRPDQTVVSFVATVTVATVSACVAPATQVCRVTPLPMIAEGAGPIVLWPRIAAVESLFAELGDLVLAASEAQMMAFGAAAGLLSTFFEIEATACEWLVKAGVAHAAASRYVRSMFHALGKSAHSQPHLGLDALAAASETAGGLNEHARRTLKQDGVFSSIDRELTALSELALGLSPRR